MKIGWGRYHPHFAHMPGAKCRLQKPESALHYNAVRDLASELRSRRELAATMRCAGAGSKRCQEHITEQIAAGWVETLVEARLPGVGPDILLRTGNRDVLAIEVRATHPVTREKAELYAQLDLPWIEIEARFIRDRWTPGEPLLLIQQRYALSSSLCVSHAELALVVAAARAAIPPQQTLASAGRFFRAGASPPEFTRRDPDPVVIGDISKFRFVDWYRSYGLRTRKLYWMTKSKEAGGWIVYIVESKWKTEITCVGPEPELEDAFRLAQEDFDRYLALRGSAADSPMPWMDSTELPAGDGLKRFPPRRRHPKCASQR
jgi:hypothetical protein